MIVRFAKMMKKKRKKKSRVLLTKGLRKRLRKRSKKHREFAKKKKKPLNNLRLCEEVDNLHGRKDKEQSHCPKLEFSPSSMTIDINVFGPLMKN